MARDHRQLRVFALADAFVVDIYRHTSNFPVEARYGLQAQMRRAAVSAATNIVEGSARRSLREYVHFLNLASSSGAEARYLVELSTRLGYLTRTDGEALDDQARRLVGGLTTLMQSLDALNEEA